MAVSVLEYLEASARRTPEQEVYEDGSHALTYGQVQALAARIGTAVCHQVRDCKKPVAVFMDKNVESIVSFLGVLYSGNFYCPLDSKMPLERIHTIMGVLKPEVVLTDAAHREEAEAFAGDSRVLLYEDAVQEPVLEDLLGAVRRQCTELDPLYVLFTSGSTGVPKGVLVSHRVVTNYLEWLGETFSIGAEDVFGNQAPLYFDVSIHDIYGALYFGAKTVIIPQEKFSFPVKLIEYLNEKRISTFLWVPSAMCIVANLDTFRYEVPRYLKQIMFAGEVLPRKQLDYWRSYVPEAIYANLYGPTETFVCTAHQMDGTEPEGEPLPIGIPVRNAQALVLGEDNRPVARGAVGELCMRGSCLALGYYHNPERTAASFVQNPLHDGYQDRIYHTGDLVRENEKGQLLYVSRKDYQIKHMGYRIELGEIETAVALLEGVQDCACIYDSRRQKIVLFYDGTPWEKKALLEQLGLRIPKYMIPGRVVHLEQMPHNANGKIDRKKLMEM